MAAVNQWQQFDIACTAAQFKLSNYHIASSIDFQYVDLPIITLPAKQTSVCHVITQSRHTVAV